MKFDFPMLLGVKSDPARRDEISSRQTGIMESPPKSRILYETTSIATFSM